jgi:methyl-accepting chemotaxis protein-1 (serine sensor receptor)
MYKDTTHTPQSMLTIKARLGLAMAFMALLMIIIGALGLVGMNTSNEADHQTYADQLPGAIAVGNMEIFVARERMALDRAALSSDDPSSAQTIVRAQGFRAASNEWWNKYLALPRDATEDRLAQDTGKRRLEMQRAVDDFIAAIKSDDHVAIVNAANRLTPAYALMTTSDDALKKYQGELAESGYQHAQRMFATFRITSIVMMLLGLLMAAMSWLSLRRAIGEPITDALAHFKRIADGDLRAKVVVKSRELDRNGDCSANRNRIDRCGNPADCNGQRRPVQQNRRAGGLTRRNRSEHGGADRHRAAKRGQRPTGQRACGQRVGNRQSWE